MKNCCWKRNPLNLICNFWFGTPCIDKRYQTKGVNLTYFVQKSSNMHFVDCQNFPMRSKKQKNVIKRLLTFRMKKGLLCDLQRLLRVSSILIKFLDQFSNFTHCLWSKWVKFGLIFTKIEVATSNTVLAYLSDLHFF